jgi:signal transduction histidine kinase
LRLQCQVLDSALDNMAHGVALFDAEQRLLVCNQRYLDLYGLPRELGAPGTALRQILEASARLQELSREQTDALIHDRLAMATSQSRATRRELMRDGRAIEIQHQPIPSGGSITTYQDMTERHRAEESLRVAKEEAELANRAKSDFLANISHQLRTPLNAIIGFSEIIQTGMFGSVSEDEYREYAKDIHDSGRHLLGVINDILDLSRIEAGRFELNEERIEVTELVGACVRIIAEQVQAKRLSVSVSIPKELPSLRADKRAFKQILLNLLSNSLKFTPAGGRITVRAMLDNDDCLALRVADNGVGIAEEARPHVLALFGRSGGLLAGGEGGTGLGLPLTMRLVELHGGTLTLKSQAGSGTAVTIRFPRWRVFPGPADTASPDLERASARAAGARSEALTPETPRRAKEPSTRGDAQRLFDRPPRRREALRRAAADPSARRPTTRFG